MAQIAKHTFFGVIRMFRRAGFALTATFGMLLMLFIAAGAAFGTGEWRDNRGGAFAADRPIEEVEKRAGRTDAPWSHVLGGREFDTITAVNQTDSGDLVFAGLSLAMEGGDGNAGHIIRTSQDGQFKARHKLETDRLGRISKITLGPEGGTRILHWLGAELAFARTSLTGEIVWSRQFFSPSDTAWGDIAAGNGGDTLIAIVDSNTSGQVRLMRLDRNGKSVWRQKLDTGQPTADLALAAAGEGGALLALASTTDQGGQVISLRRFDHRGRLAWQREVYRGQTARLAGAQLDTDRVALLIAGEPAGLFVYDTFGTPVWVRELTPLNEHGRHALTRRAGHGYQVIGEPRHADGSGDIWLASYGEDGRELWTRARTNRTNSIFEDLHVAADGTIIAGGSLTDPLAGNTDMLMMRLTEDGEFPSGYENMAVEAPLFAARPSAATRTSGSATIDGHSVHAVASSRLPVIAASVIVDEVVAEAERQAMTDRARAVTDTQALTRQVAATVPSDDDTSDSEAVMPEAQTKPVQRTDKPRSENEREDTEFVSSTLSSTPQEATGEIKRPLDIADEPQLRMAATRAPEPVSRKLARRPMPDPRPTVEAEARSFAYRCTFTCAAKADDTVKYPVDKVIRDVSEENAGLVALDVLAMDNGVCLASGGVVFDAPRLPPVCQRVD